MSVDRPKFGPIGRQLDQFTQTSQRIFENLGGKTPIEIETMQGESARPIAMDVMRVVTLGMRLLEAWGFEAELPENVTPSTELEARRTRKTFK